MINKKTYKTKAKPAADEYNFEELVESALSRLENLASKDARVVRAKRILQLYTTEQRREDLFSHLYRFYVGNHWFALSEEYKRKKAKHALWMNHDERYMFLTGFDNQILVALMNTAEASELLSFSKEDHEIFEMKDIIRTLHTLKEDATVTKTLFRYNLFELVMNDTVMEWEIDTDKLILIAVITKDVELVEVYKELPNAYLIEVIKSLDSAGSRT